MAEPNNPWSAFVAAAEETIRRIERGDPFAARDAIRTATVGLRGVLAGRVLDPEQTVYVKWLVDALDRLNPDYHFLRGRKIPNSDAQLAKEFDANKALGLVIAHAPPVSEDRDVVLCLWTHEERGKSRYNSMEQSPALKLAFAAVAKRATKKFGKPVTTATVARA